MSLFKSHKNQTTSAAQTPAQTPRTSTSDPEHRPAGSSSAAASNSKTPVKPEAQTMHQLMDIIMHGGHNGIVL
ncbi:hypothetical protein BGW38_010900 [Lunasporangiospora selenospora]|uniref:Uncharacterized protein n=1 Tax=Lunasporangiospora selenospora TaxID=979761 RepID=A0A9P6FVK8_9FUNG|nr:hypothetical protein BGW38_010900 [Lunasporangiospora selenospora]